MGWLASGMDTLSGWLGLPEADGSTPTQRLEAVRHAMLDMLGVAGAAEHPHLARRLRYTADPQALWYLRSELMNVLSLREGEPAAREKVAALGTRFNGLLPSGMRQTARLRAAPR